MNIIGLKVYSEKTYFIDHRLHYLFWAGQGGFYVRYHCIIRPDMWATCDVFYILFNTSEEIELEYTMED